MQNSERSSYRGRALLSVHLLEQASASRYFGWGIRRPTLYSLSRQRMLGTRAVRRLQGSQVRLKALRIRKEDPDGFQIPIQAVVVRAMGGKTTKGEYGARRDKGLEHMADHTGMSKIQRAVEAPTCAPGRISTIDDENVMLKQVTIKEPSYYCYKDEENFYRWLEAINGVERAMGSPNGLTLHIKEVGLDRDDWADLIGLLMRYGVDMKSLRGLVSDVHEAWLKDPEKFWHHKMWG